MISGVASARIPVGPSRLLASWWTMHSAVEFSIPVQARCRSQRRAPGAGAPGSRRTSLNISAVVSRFRTYDRVTRLSRISYRSGRGHQHCYSRFTLTTDHLLLPTIIKTHLSSLRHQTAHLLVLTTLDLRFGTTRVANPDTIRAASQSSIYRHPADAHRSSVPNRVKDRTAVSSPCGG